MEKWPQNSLMQKIAIIKKVDCFETLRLWEFLDKKLVSQEFIYLYDIDSYLDLPFRNPHHV